MDRGRFKSGRVPWNKDKPSHMERCNKCGLFLSSTKKHICKNVDLRGDRFCKECNTKLKNESWERYSKVCGKCGKIIQRRKEKELRKKLIKQFGGKCQICSYSKVKECLEFHHKNRKDKKGSHFLKQIVKNPERYILVCNRCHREIHFGYRRIKLIVRQ